MAYIKRHEEAREICRDELNKVEREARPMNHQL